MNQIRDRAQRSGRRCSVGRSVRSPVPIPFVPLPAVRRLRHCRRWQRSRLRPRDCRCRRRHWRRSGHRRRRVATLAAIAARLVVGLFAAVIMAPDAPLASAFPPFPLGCVPAAIGQMLPVAPFRRATGGRRGPAVSTLPRGTRCSRVGAACSGYAAGAAVGTALRWCASDGAGKSRCIRRRPTPPAPLNNGAAPVGTRRGTVVARRRRVTAGSAVPAPP